jgi:hypothetical protein
MTDELARLVPAPDLLALDADIGQRRMATFVAPSEVVEQGQLVTHVYRPAR